MHCRTGGYCRFSFIAIPRWGILGACIATTSSYFVSAFLLFRKFYSSTPFNWKDYMVSKEEIQLLKQKLSKK
ncbi:polysaccharide biosynthesis C-terminal domain-containing protein [Chryseobacterium sp. 7]|uniref:polysaccharide biosynthesis C-terminal domain-containing protein n=1 Tax=Chryseobacterium sp. 7 TaxID=2035214 RepID=UPI001E3CC3AF|nr:polysaccharide biosynthesis C-terminal domain-containing protein [Chryseobacterium sp. 7]